MLTKYYCTYFLYIFLYVCHCIAQQHVRVPSSLQDAKNKMEVKHARAKACHSTD